MATVTISKRPRKKKRCSYAVYYVDPQTKKKTYHATFDRKGDALKAKDRLKIALDGGEAIETLRTCKTMRSKTVNHFCDCKEKEWKRRGLEGSLSPTTVKDYLLRLNLVRKTFGNKLIGTITEEQLLDFRAQEVHRNSPASANRYMFAVRQVMNLAFKEKAITVNPSASIKLLSEEQHKRTVFLTPSEVENMLEHAANQKTRHYMLLAILLAVEHGCARQEVLDLKWSHIDLDFQDTGTITFFRTKNKNDRIHAIMPRTREALLNRKAHLEKMRKKRGIKVRDEYVIGRLDGTGFKDVNNAWRTIRKACGFNKKVTFHDQRHTYCTNIVLSGSSTKHAAAMIGHNDPRMTERYTNLENLLHNPAQDRLAAHYKNTKKSK